MRSTICRGIESIALDLFLGKSAWNESTVFLGSREVLADNNPYMFNRRHGEVAGSKADDVIKRKLEHSVGLWLAGMERRCCISPQYSAAEIMNDTNYSFGVQPIWGWRMQSR